MAKRMKKQGAEGPGNANDRYPWGARLPQDAQRGALESNKASRNGALALRLALLVIVFCAVLAVAYVVGGRITLAAIVVAVLAAALIAACVHVTFEWERLVVFRLGRFSRVAGPGVTFVIPLIEQVAMRVDQRTVATTFGAEQTLTSDLVPLDIDAVLYWMVWDAKAACTEVEDYCASVLFVAQTAMRDAIGRMSIADVALRRDQLDKELQEAIERETEAWGIAVLSVKVRDIVVPQQLQEAMSLEAQAEREKNARLILADAEGEISEALSDAAKTYDESDTALKLRTMHLLYDTVGKSGGTVVTVPSSLSDGVSGEVSDLVEQVLKGK